MTFSMECRTAAAAAKLLQSCPTLCDPRDGSPPGSPVPGIPQARTLEWVAISFSNAWKWKVKVKSVNHVRLLATPWTAAHQAPPSMGFSRQEYWSGLPLPSPMSGLGHLSWRGSPIWSPWANPRMLFHWAEILKKLKYTVQWQLILLHACMLSSFSSSKPI